MYKIFIRNKKVFLTNNPANIQEILTQSNIILLNYDENNDIQQIVSGFILNDKSESSVIIFCKNIEKLKNDFFACFEVIEAAGGVVFNPENEILLIHRRGFWDLPKGKIDDGETIFQAALREVEEETGINNVEIVKPIELKYNQAHITYHYYEMNGKQYIKLSYWFVMKINEPQNLIPQTEEDIEQAVWTKTEIIPSLYGNMYESVIDVIEGVI